MPVLFVELQLAEFRAPCLVASYGFEQGTDYAGPTPRCTWACSQ
jgi:hypothetical protein